MVRASTCRTVPTRIWCQRSAFGSALVKSSLLITEAGVTTVFDELLGTEVPVDPQEMLFACFAGLPRGWSWALFLCQEAVANCGIIVQQRLGLGPLPLLDGFPSPMLTSRRAVTAPYVDNGDILGGSKHVTAALLGAFKEELAKVGFQLHEEMEPCRQLEVLGRVLALQERELRTEPRRWWRLWKALDQVVSRPWLSPDQLRGWAPR